MTRSLEKTHVCMKFEISSSGPASQFRGVNAYWASVVFYKKCVVGIGCLLFYSGPGRALTTSKKSCQSCSVAWPGGGVRICQHFFHVDKFGRMFRSFAQIDGNSPVETDLTAHYYATQTPPSTELKYPTQRPPASGWIGKFHIRRGR